MALAAEAPVHGAVPPPGPRRRTGRIVTLAIAGAAIGILAAAAFPLTGVFLEKYYLGKLGSNVLEERLTAARKLGDMRAVRAVPDLLGIVAAPEVRFAVVTPPYPPVRHDLSDCFSPEDSGWDSGGALGCDSGVGQDRGRPGILPVL